MNQASRGGGDDTPRRKPADLRPLARLAPYVTAHSGLAGAALVFILASSASILGLTAAGRFAVDQGVHVRRAGDLVVGLSALAAVSAVFALTTGLRLYFVTVLGERVAADLRRALYDRVLALDPSWFTGMRTGEVLARLTGDVATVENMTGSVVSVSLRSALSLVGAMTLMIVLRPVLAGLILLLLPLVLAPLLLSRRRLRGESAAAQDRFGEAIGYAGESIEGLETVQAFGREAHASARFAEAVEVAYAASKVRLRTRSALTILLITLVVGGLLAVIAQCAYATFVAHTLSPGLLVQLVVLTMVAASAVSALGEGWGEVQKAAGAMQRIGVLLDAEPAVALPTSPRPMPSPPRGEVSFEGVSFSYPGRPDWPALRGFSLRVGAGERVALVGPSGAGKSTVFRLLLRFYDPQAGVVRIDGVDLREAALAEVRGRSALVAQDAPAFSGALAENIRFGRGDAGAEEVEAAARAAQLNGDLSRQVGERGRALSGGQRQRLALARALVRGAPILLLDEATSALDAENERLVQAALDEAGRRRTTLVIAHRLSTVQASDRIVVMDGGRVVEEGRHEELVARGGLYARLAALQFAA